ncbi:hypothetical protein ACIGO6_10485 [Streptomyces sp. NPDC053750]|uniref:hypothetical protein n=1 Tax=Streptomyces sp. NPDC053750 TaxID=3365714 RepID=UPI0037D024E0
MERAVLLECDRTPAELLPLMSGLIARKRVLSGEPLLIVLHLLPCFHTQRIGLGLHSLALGGELGPTAGDALFDRLPL